MIHPPHHDQQQEEEEEEKPPGHLLDMLRKRLIPAVKRKEESVNQIQTKKGDSLQGNKRDGHLGKLMRNWCSSCDKSRHRYTFRTATELKDKDIRFMASETSSFITEIDFNDRCCMPTLTLAPILVDDNTKPKLLNLIAHEMSPDFENKYEITSYVLFLDSLINSGEDTKVLRHAGVLYNELGSDEAAANLLNKISDNLVPNLEIHSGLKARIQEHCNSHQAHFSSVWTSVQAQLTNTYFRRPWSMLVFLGTVAGLIYYGSSAYL